MATGLKKKKTGPGSSQSTNVIELKTDENGATMAFMIVLSLLTGVSFFVHILINAEQPDPYMDEIFHVPQTQKYCQGIYSEWDPKITTLPGTYTAASTLLSILNVFFPGQNLCSTFYLRGFNVGISILNFCLIYYILGYYNPDMCHLKRALSALNISTVPILYFFSFLYYTDAVSTASLLFMHSLYLSGKFGYSALVGAYAVFTRQTNIVWVFYHGTNSILEILTNKFGENVFLLPLEGKKFFTSWFSMSKITKIKRSKQIVKRPKKHVNARPYNVETTRIWKVCGDDFIDHGCGYVIVGLLFFIFIVYNGSIVVGDKDAHQASLNFPQFLYFALVVGIFILPFMTSRVKYVGSQLVESLYNVLWMGSVFAIAIFFNSPVHPYLLADNRHYTFYVWKRFYENVPCYRYMLIPFYIMVWTLITSTMGLPKVLVYNYVFCTLINLVPQLLLEFRYFIPAYLFARLTFKNVTWFELILEFCVHQSFNILTLYIFLNIPFRWVDTPGIQRFMW